MTTSSAFVAARATATVPLALPSETAAPIIAAVQILLPHLEQGRRVDAAILRAAMEQAFGGSDTSGAWDWKTAYDACEAATVLFLRKYGKALLRKSGSPAQALHMLEKVVGLLPTHTRRSLESEAYQQFSTPVPLGLAVLTAAAITPADRVLEPSAGIGLLAILAEIAGGSLVLNELAETRAGILSLVFPNVGVTRHDAAQIHDHLDAAVVPSVVIMNPPFSAMANVQGRMADAALRHIGSALARLPDGGRLVAITGANFAPDAGLCQARHDVSNAADRDRQATGRRSDRVPACPQCRVGRLRADGEDRGAGPGAIAGRSLYHCAAGRRDAPHGTRLYRPRRTLQLTSDERGRLHGRRSRL